MCGYFLNYTSEKPVLMSGYMVDAASSSVGTVLGGESLLTRAFPLVSAFTRESFFNGSIKFKDVRNPIVDVLFTSVEGGIFDVYRNKTPKAQECILTWCTKTINSTYLYGAYEEKVVHTFINKTAGPWPWTTRVQNNITFQNYLQDITVDASSIGRNTSGFGVSSGIAVNVINVFDDIFPSFTTQANASEPSWFRYHTYQKMKPLTRHLDVNGWQSNFTLHMERLAGALTSVVRTSPKTSPVIGLAYCTESYVSVRWQWLTLPLGLLFLSLIFLAAVIMRTSTEKERVGVWKTSAIATLLYGLPDDMQHKLGTSTQTGTPRAKVRNLRVRLLPTKMWRVSGNLFSPATPRPRPAPPLPGWI